MRGAILLAALLMPAASGADARDRPSIPVPPVVDRPMFPGQGFIIVEREVVVERPVVVEVPAKEPPPPPPAPPPEPRKPYAVGNTYASLPGGCMKLIEASGTYYHCSGEWYQRVGGEYKAVKAP